MAATRPLMPAGPIERAVIPASRPGSTAARAEEASRTRTTKASLRIGKPPLKSFDADIGRPELRRRFPWVRGDWRRLRLARRFRTGLPKRRFSEANRPLGDVSLAR